MGIGENPWEEMGISKATYYRRQSHKDETNDETETKIDETETKVSQSHETVSPGEKDPNTVFNGENGNECLDITREQMQAVLDRDPSFVPPNWFRSGRWHRNIKL